MATWVDQHSEGAFEGCLVVMNIGNENCSSFPAKYREDVYDAIANSHAAGHLVLYVFDNERGAQPPPDEFPQFEGMDVVRMGFDICNRKVFEFSPDPSQRLAELGEFVSAAICNGKFSVRGPRKIVGACVVGTEQTLLPLTEIV
jgi:hypothetical protein